MAGSARVQLRQPDVAAQRPHLLPGVLRGTQHPLRLRAPAYPPPLLQPGNPGRPQEDGEAQGEGGWVREVGKREKERCRHLKRIFVSYLISRAFLSN